MSWPEKGVSSEGLKIRVFPVAKAGTKFPLGRCRGKLKGPRTAKTPRGILFVGSDITGRKILRKALEQPGKIAALEMGGKNAALVFPDASLDQVVSDCLKSAYATTGQRCTSLSRIIIHQSLLGRFLDKFLREIPHWKVGYYRNSQAKMGPMVSETAVRRFLSYQQRAKAEGGKPLLQGKRLSLLTPGYYVSPSVHLVEKYRPKKKQVGYLYDEIFGPDVAVYTFKDFEEAVAIHNDCRYGLVASVYTKKKGVFNKAIHSLEVGNLFLNRPTVGASSRLPFGGVKASGNDFPAGLFSPYYCAHPVAIQE